MTRKAAGKVEVAFHGNLFSTLQDHQEPTHAKLSTAKRHCNISGKIVIFVSQLPSKTYKREIVGAAVSKIFAPVIEPAVGHKRLSRLCNNERNHNDARDCAHDHRVSRNRANWNTNSMQPSIGTYKESQPQPIIPPDTTSNGAAPQFPEHVFIVAGGGGGGAWRWRRWGARWWRWWRAWWWRAWW